MFKKFKDKLAEEMKQSPARLQASMQQLAQAVVSPALSNSSIQEVSTSNFSLTEDGDETPKNTPAKHSFQNVDLMSPSPNHMEISRRSSVNSVTSDVSSLFPMYESPPNLYHLQSDIDQSASEVDDNISPHLDRITKDQLYSAYRKVQAKYHKYRGRYSDLATHYRELDRVKIRLESVLVETQDKVLRRIADLKEQCQLEQQAKAHLEEALRNDIEEKDHIINTLNTKVKLLQVSEPPLENSVSEDIDQNETSKSNLIDLTNESSNENSALSAENIQLKDKLKKLESLVLKYKESLKRNKDKFTEVMKEKNILESDYEALKSSTAEKIGAMEDELNVARGEIEGLAEQVDILHKREEESAISLAENKLSVHRELEEKEEQLKQLRIDLKLTAEDKENLEEALEKYKTELNKLKLPHDDSNLAVDKNVVAHDTPQEKTVMTESTQETEIKYQEKIDHGKEILTEVGKDVNTPAEITLRLKETEVECRELQDKLDELEKQVVEYKYNGELLQTDLSNYKLKYSELKNEYDAQKIIMDEKRKNADATIEKLQATVQSVDKELENMRNALIDRDQVCENYNKKVQQYATMLEKAKHKLTEQDAQIKSLKERLEDKTELAKMQEELDNKQTALNAVQGDLELCKSTIDDLRNKVQADSSAISLLKKERSDLINRLVYYKDYMRCLKRDCANFKDVVREELSNRKTEISEINATLAASLVKLEESNAAALNSQMEKLRSELDKITNLKSHLETELEENNEKLRGMTLKSNRYDEVNTTNNKLIAEIDNLHFKIHDLEKTSHELIESREEVRLLQERLKIRDEKVEEQEQHIAHLISTCDSHIQTTEEHVRKYLNLEEEYHSTRENHAKQTAELMENNKVLQETINVKLVQLKKMKIIKERQSKTIEETSTELNGLKAKTVELSNALEAAVKQIESLKLENSQLVTITLENKDLKDKHNSLLSRNRKLCENEEALKEKIANDEKKIEELRKNVELCKSEMSGRNEEIERLNNQLITTNVQIECKNTQLNSQNDRLAMNEEELREIKCKLNEQSVEFRNKVSELNTVAANSNVVKEENEQLSTQLRSLQDEIVRIKKAEDKNKTEWKSQLNDLIRKNSDVDALRSENDKLIVERDTLQNKIFDMENVNARNMELQAHVNNLQSKMSSLETVKVENDKLQSEIDILRNAKNSSTDLNALKYLLAEKEEEMKLLRDKNSNMLQEIGNLKHFSLEVDEKTKKANVLKNSITLLEGKVASLQLEINSHVETNDTLRKELATLRDDGNIEGQFDNDKLRDENKRLEAQLDEALITFQAKETQMQVVNNELKMQIDRLKEQLKINEEEQGMRLKQLVKEFQAQLHDKEEELQAALEKRFDRQHNYETNLVQQYKEQLKDFQVELTEKSEQIESLVLEKKDAVAEKGKDIERLVDTIAQIKKEHANEIKETEKKWKAVMQQRIDNLQAKHEEELNELTKEWQNERKPDTRTEAASEELESTSRVAMAAIQTNTGSIHTMQQTLTSQRREIVELRKLVKLRHDALEDSTEIEYLRNILFEYMMGRETMVLARVIAAVVKFDQEQTTRILKKEEDKLTLLGSLGLT